MVCGDCVRSQTDGSGLPTEHWPFLLDNRAENLCPFHVCAGIGEDMTAPPLFELWHYGTLRCLMTPRDGQPPFCVDLYDGERLLSHREFGDHDAAIECAVRALRRAADPDAGSAS